MKLNLKFSFNYPAKEVFLTFRDKTKEFAKHIPNVTKVEIKERKKVGSHCQKLTIVWYGFGHIPVIVRSIVKPEMIKWKEEDIWDEKDLICHWKCSPFYFQEFFTCEGKWIFKEKGGNSQVELEGILKIYIPSFPGVPDAIARVAGGVMEKVIYKYLEPNLKATINAIKKLL